MYRFVLIEDIPLLEFMYLVKLYLHASQERVTVGEKVFIVVLVLCILSAN